MKINRKRAILYGWMTLVFSILWVFGYSHTYPGQTGELIVNTIWRMLLVIVLNYIFLEYSIPFVFRKRRYLISNILLGVLLLFIHMMLWSYGIYGWRALGVALLIYTPLASFNDLEHALSAQMAFSAGSVVFFAIIRHIYNYQQLKHAAQLLRFEKQAAELNYLRSQTNPHFLFNTLN